VLEQPHTNWLLTIAGNPDTEDQTIMECRMYYGYSWDLYGAPAISFDWVSPGAHNRTPQDAPYSFDGYFLWRKFERGDPTVNGIYSDRMQQWDPEKWSDAMRGRKQTWQNMPQSEAIDIIQKYYGDDVELVGYATECNASNGYPLGIFFLRNKV
jgi:hypothetical protein